LTTDLSDEVCCYDCFYWCGRCSRVVGDLTHFATSPACSNFKARQSEYYLKGIYPVEIVSAMQDGFVDVRVRTSFLHTSEYSADGKRQVRVGVTEKRWVKPGEVLRVPFRHVWSSRRPAPKGYR
jgi:hypothetical protein